MGNLSAPLMEVSRLLDLVPYLSTHSHISVRELALEFGVTEKEMTRELTNLSMCGLPGYTPYELIEVFFDSGYVTINNHQPLDLPRALTTEEIAALSIGLQLLLDHTPESDGDSVTAIAELISELRGEVTERVALQPDSTNQTYTLLQSAILRRAALTIAYTGALSESAQERIIEPLEVVEDAGALYLNAYCHFASGYRTFRLDRIQVLGEVEIESEKNLEAGLGRGLQSATPSVLEVRVLAQARRYMEIFKGEFRQGSIVSNFFNTQWLLRVIIASGGDLELISPEDLRPEIAAGARKILALYSS